MADNQKSEIKNRINKIMRSEEYELEKSKTNGQLIIVLSIIIVVVIATSFAFVLAYQRDQYDSASKVIEITVSTSFSLILTVLGYFFGKEAGKKEDKNLKK